MSGISVKRFIEVLKENNIPDDATIWSDSGWEVNSTAVDTIYYSKEHNQVLLTQFEYCKMDLNEHIGYKDLVRIYTIPNEELSEADLNHIKEMLELEEEYKLYE